MFREGEFSSGAADTVDANSVLAIMSRLAAEGINNQALSRLTGYPIELFDKLAAGELNGEIATIIEGQVRKVADDAKRQLAMG